MSKEAMKLALAYMQQSGFQVGVNEVVTALKEALNHCEDNLDMVKQEQGEPVAATDTQISYEAHAEDPLDWNDLNFKECWHEGFSAGFRAAETFHKIGVSK